MCSTLSEWKFAAAERSIRNFTNNIYKKKNYKYMNKLSKYMYIDSIDDIINKWNNIYCCTY